MRMGGDEGGSTSRASKPPISNMPEEIDGAAARRAKEACALAVNLRVVISDRRDRA